uniref:Odorant receptor n=1 Tax=Cephus cinctus TaxID=211228 RepID=S5TM05_CEPCN|nr:odorant receptor Or4b [Cephus cinctus]
MEVLPLCFKLWTLSGVWRPMHYSSPVSKSLYTVYSLAVLITLYSLTFFEFLDIVFNFGSLDDFANTAFLLLSMIIICCKATNTLKKRAQIIEIHDLLRAEICRGQNTTENLMLEKFAKTCRSNTLNLFTMMMSCAMCLTLESLLYHVNDRLLPMKIWLPYSLSSLTLFSLSFLYQVVTMTLANAITVANDTYITGLMIEICAQLEILKLRLVELHDPKTLQMDENYSFNREKDILKMCIQHHNHIFKVKANVEKAFNSIFLIQIVTSTLVFCVTALTFLKHEILSVELASVILYFFTMMFQLFLFCWYGNKVILKSTEVRSAVFEMDWIPLPQAIKKDFIFLMMRTNIPIRFTSGYVVTLSLDSFMAILNYRTPH